MPGIKDRNSERRKFNAEKMPPANEQNKEQDVYFKSLDESRNETYLVGEKILRWFMYFLFGVICTFIACLTAIFLYLLAVYFCRLSMDQETLRSFLERAWNTLSSAALGAYIPLLIFFLKRRDNQKK